MAVINKPGYQGSETTSAEVIIYHEGDDPILLRDRDSSPVSGRYLRDPHDSLISVQTNKVLGAGSGDWSIQLKPTQGSRELLDRIVDDDWVDIIFKKHNRKFHVMRGLVNNIREQQSILGDGTTSTVISITGKDFVKIWEKTPIWFNRYTAENVEGGISLQIMSSKKIWGNNPAEVVEIFLYDFLQKLREDLGRANWTMPLSMPGIVSQNFIENVGLFDSDLAKTPVRSAVDPNFFTQQGMIWALAKEWSDPLFNELIADTFQYEENRGYIYTEDEVTPENSIMGVIIRDRPFPLVSEGYQTKWFDIPLFLISKQDIVNKNIGRGGEERYNAFFVAPQVLQEWIGTDIIDTSQPLWNKDDIKRHGLRRFDVSTRYSNIDGDVLSAVKVWRQNICDWYMMNPYLYNGTIELGVCRPDIKIGTRVGIAGEQGPNQNEQYYVESVGNNWQFGTGGRTSLGVTRGWIGTDTELVRKTQEVSWRYKVEDAPKDLIADITTVAV